MGRGATSTCWVDFGTRKSLLDQDRIESELSELVGRPVDLLTERALSTPLAQDAGPSEA